MFLITFFTTIYNILAGAAAFNLFDQLLIKIDIGVYKLVSTSFTLFTIMCQLNLNVIYSIANGIVDRLKALIIVFVIFKVGVSLIKYLLDPENAANASKKLLINLLVCAVLLLSYNLVFKAFNELSMMIVGKPASYHYTTLKQIANVSDSADEGLIMRLFFGKKGNVSINTTEDMGKELAFNSLCATFPDKEGNGLQCTHLSKELKPKNGEVNIDKLENILPHIKKNVDAHPAIAAILGLYMVFTVVKASVAIGTRMFKLMLLQLVAPIAIISVASEEGVKAKPFTQFRQVYVEVFLSAFIRIAAILLVTVFVSKVFIQIDGIIGDVTNSASSNYSLWIILICIFAGYKFAEDIPAMIEKIFEKKMGDAGGKGFGKFLGTLMALPTLGALGVARGAFSGEGWQSRLYGGVAGGLGGMAAALQGNTIADKFKAMNENQKRISGVQAGISAADGNAAAYLWGRLQGKDYQDRYVGRRDREASGWDSVANNIDALEAERNSRIANVAVTTADDFEGGHYDAADLDGVKWGDKKDSFVSSIVNKDKNVRAAEAAYQANKTEANKEAYDRAIHAASDYAGKMYDRKRNSLDKNDEEKRLIKKIQDDSEKLGHRLFVDTTELAKNVKNVNASGVDTSAKAQAKRYAQEAKLEAQEMKDTAAYRGTHAGK